jgi:hypothetical protein
MRPYPEIGEHTMHDFFSGIVVLKYPGGEPKALLNMPVIKLFEGTATTAAYF